MTVEQEDKLRNGIFFLGFLFSLFETVTSMRIIKNDEIKLLIMFSILPIYGILIYRKINREKMQGKVVSKYDTVWFWLIVGTFILVAVMYILNFFYLGLMNKSIL